MKNLLTVVLVSLLSNLVCAQVKFNLTYVEATKTYTVSALPEASWNAPLNMVSSAQIVLRVDADKAFIPGITSLINGLIWADNAYIESPVGAPEYTFVCISLINGPTNKIPLVADQETALFSFVNSGSDCAGKLALLSNEDPIIQTIRASGFNVTQYLPVLGARGNAFTGIVNGEVDCSAATATLEPNKIIDEVMISPVPADKEVRVQWTQLSEQEGLRQLVICDVKGAEIFREKISGGKGAHTQSINVENWQAGMYRLRFVFENSQQTKAWNLMVIH